MLQRGIETPDMDVRWVSSLSWYFLNFFGLNGLYRLILGNDNCMFGSGISFAFEIRDRSCAIFFHPALIFHPDAHASPPQIHSRPSDLSNWRFLTGNFLIATSLLCCAGQYHTWPNQNDQRRPNRRRRWQAHLPGRCNRANLVSRWTITRSFRLSGTTSNLLRGYIIGLAMTLRPVF